MSLRHSNWRRLLPGPLRALGPYAVIELVLPGGSLIALLLWAFRHRIWLAERGRQTLAAMLGPSQEFLATLRAGARAHSH
jgi:hypothetical protein